MNIPFDAYLFYFVPLLVVGILAVIMTKDGGDK
jgi:hypothetical protein